MEVREVPRVGKACTTMPLSLISHLALVAAAVASSTRPTTANVKAPHSHPPAPAPHRSTRPQVPRTPASLAPTIAVVVERTTSDTSPTVAVADRARKYIFEEALVGALVRSLVGSLRQPGQPETSFSRLTKDQEWYREIDMRARELKFACLDYHSRPRSACI